MALMGTDSTDAAGSIVDLTSMPDRNDQNYKAVALDGCHDAVITNPVAPQSLEIAHQCVTKASRVLSSGNPVAQIGQNLSLGLMTELAQISGGVTVKLDTPDGLRGHRRVSANNSCSSDSRLTRADFRPSRLRAKW